MTDTNRSSGKQSARLSRSSSSRNSSSLYPDFGTGKKPFRKCFQAYTFKTINRNDLNCGDKIILPEKTLKDMKRLRLPFPFCFEIRRGNTVNHWKNDTKDILSNNKYRQFCSALEFSGKDTTKIYIPIWMFKSLRIKNGASITISSALNLPKGESITIQPDKTEFIDLIHELGPQAFLENAMKSYSVLSLNQRLLINIDDKRFYIKLTETKPKNVISILGDVDLNIEFAPPADCPEADEIQTANKKSTTLASVAKNKKSNSNERKKKKNNNSKKQPTTTTKKTSNNNNNIQKNKQSPKKIITQPSTNSIKEQEEDAEEENNQNKYEKIDEEDWDTNVVSGFNNNSVSNLCNKIEDISVDDHKSMDDGIVVDQEDPETRKRRVREAAMKRYEKLMGGM